MGSTINGGNLGLLVGRSNELAELERLIKTERLITLTGPGGVGKTRLAAELVDRRRDEHLTLFIDLEATGSSMTIAEAVGRALIGEQYATMDPLGAIAAALGRSELLLVLDCLDHAIRDATDITELLDLCPGLRIVITCQRRLGIRGERVFAIRPLQLPVHGSDPWSSPSVSLLAELIERTGHRVNTDSGEHLAAICHRAGGVPLALELIAGWVSIHLPEELADLLDGSLELFSGGGPDLPDRHRDLRSLISWSCDDLADGEREVLDAIALVPGGAARELLAEICQRSVEADLRALAERHLVIDAEAHVGSGTKVFDVLDPIRTYFLESVDGHVARLRDRLHEAVRASAADLGPRIGYRGTATAIRKLMAIDSLLAPSIEAMVAADDRAAVALALDLVPYWTHTARYDTGIRALTVVEGLAIGPSDAARVLTARTLLMLRVGDGDAVRFGNDALEHARQVPDDPAIEARAAIALSQALMAKEQFGRAVELLERCAQYVLPKADRVALATTLAGVRYNAGDLPGARLTLVGHDDDPSFPFPIRLDLAAIKLLVHMAGLDTPRSPALVEPAQRLLDDREWPTKELVRLRYWTAQYLLQGGFTATALELTENLVLEAEASGITVRIATACAVRAAALAMSGDIAAALHLTHRAVELSGTGGELYSEIFVDVADFGARLGLVRADIARIVSVALSPTVTGPIVDISMGVTSPRGFEIAMTDCGLTAVELAAARRRELTDIDLRRELDWLQSVIATRIDTLDRSAARPFPELSDREVDVLALVADGRTDKEIAAHLIIGVRTVNSHVGNILRKLTVPNRRAAVGCYRDRTGQRLSA